MADRPILFSAPMVRAILSGEKTQTRRKALKTSQPHNVRVTDFDQAQCLVEIENRHARTRSWKACPYGRPGDQLWIRETWAYGTHALGAANDEEGPFVYAADGTTQGRLCDRWRPSIHMPRHACRITLAITSVRVERLNTISEADALAEGVSYDPGEGGTFHVPGLAGCSSDSAADSYRKLWDHINGPGSADADPWVWAVTFERITP